MGSHEARWDLTVRRNKLLFSMTSTIELMVRYASKYWSPTAYHRNSFFSQSSYLSAPSFLNCLIPSCWACDAGTCFNRVGG